MPRKLHPSKQETANGRNAVVHFALQDSRTRMSGLGQHKKRVG
jgi:hypothetical protein